MMSVKLGLVQIKGNCLKSGNFQKALSLVRDSASSGAKIITLPELFLHPYFCRKQNARHFSLAHSREKPELQALGKLAAELEAVLTVPFFEKREKGIYHNSALVFDADGSEAGLYRKMHVPEDPGFHEKYYFTPGNLGFRSFVTKYGRIGVLICWDQWFPEAARLTALQGCDIILCPTAIAWDRQEQKGLSGAEREKLRQEQLQSWKTVQKSHAIANGIFWAAVNRVGTEGNLEFWGNSFACNTLGGELGSLDETEEGVLVVDCELEEIERTRNTWPFFRDRRVDSYAGLTA